MQAFIPSAGLGTRLRPLTDNCPKALVQVGNRTLLEHAISRVIDAGAHHIVVNVHHHAQQIIDFLTSHSWEAEIRISDEREQLLDTGGGLRHAAPLFLHDEPILTYNVDVISCFDLKDLYRKHLAESNLVTLAVSRRDSSRQLLFDADGKLTGWHNRQSNSYLWSSQPSGQVVEMAYSGIALIDPVLLQLLPQTPPPYPIIPELVRLAQERHIGALVHNCRDWIDVGRHETLQQLEQTYRRHGKFFA